MVIIASPSTKATVRKSARRQRKAKLSSQQQTATSLEAPDWRASKRRKLRHQHSRNLEGYSYACGDQGFHHDPDFHLGHDAARKGMFPRPFVSITANLRWKRTPISYWQLKLQTRLRLLPMKLPSSSPLRPIHNAAKLLPMRHQEEAQSQ